MIVAVLGVLWTVSAMAQQAQSDPTVTVLVALIGAGGVVAGGFFGLLGVIVTTRGVGRKVDAVQETADVAVAELNRNGGKSTKDQVVTTAGSVKKIERRLADGDERFDQLEGRLEGIEAGVSLLLAAAGIHVEEG